MNFQISAIINGHKEKLISYKSLKNFFMTCEFAESAGISVQKIGILDNADEETRQQFFKFSEKFDQIVEIDSGDLAFARNKGVASSSGEYIAFLDADDLWCDDWLKKAFDYSVSLGNQDFILHPQKNVYFGCGQLRLWEHEDSDNLKPDKAGILLFENLWTSLCFAKRDIFTRYPYCATKLGTGYGYEDWHWNCETLGQGIRHLVVKDTRHFIRIKNSSLLRNHNSALATVRPNRLFANFEKFQPELDVFFESGQEKTSRRSGLEVLSKDDIEAMKSLVYCEQELFPSEERLKKCTHYVPRERLGSRVFAVAMGMVSKLPKVTHVIIVPWLKRGGADLAALIHARSIVESSPDNFVLFIGTEDSASTWLGKLPQRSSYLPLGQIASGTPTDEKNTVLLRLILQLNPEVVHVVQSHSGWTLLCSYGEALRSQSKLFASVYLDGTTSEGEKVGYARTFLGGCYQVLTKVFSDNQTYINGLCTEFGYDYDLFKVLKHPLMEEFANPPRLQKEGQKFLWASRLDKQKRPDILLSIARQNPHVDFDVYGESVLNSGPYIEELLANLPSNINLKGKYDSFFEIVGGFEYCGFVYTSEGDGLPNILIEAGACELPVIAPDVGGVAELVNNETGYLISQCEAVEEYSKAINLIQANPLIARQKAQALRSRVLYEHSWESFANALISSGYIGG